MTWGVGVYLCTTAAQVNEEYEARDLQHNSIKTWTMWLPESFTKIEPTGGFLRQMVKPDFNPS